MNTIHPNAQTSSFNRTSESVLIAKSVCFLNSCEFWGYNPQFSKHQTLWNVNSTYSRARTVFWKPCPCLHNKYLRFWSVCPSSNNIQTWVRFWITFYFYNAYKLLLFNLYKIQTYVFDAFSCVQNQNLCFPNVSFVELSFE